MARESNIALARIHPVKPAPANNLAPRQLSPREKAAVIVRLMLAQGANLPLSSLPEHMQAAITEQMGQMRLVDRATLGQIVDEFLGELEEVGLSFPGGIEGALSMMDGHISETAANRLRRLAGASSKADPWDRLTGLAAERLLPIIDQESVEIAAVMLSKLPVQKAADLLSKMPGERARRVAYAMSMTANVDPETVRRIGIALSAQLENQAPKAFDAGPVERIGAILNISPVLTREDVLKGLDETDAGFAEQVRKALFTFIHIGSRLTARDVPKVVRVVDNEVLVTALTYATTKADLAPVVEFIISSLSQRMGQSLREEMAGRGKIKDKDGETAMSAVVTGIRQLEAAGEVILRTEGEED
ncbi:MAG: flagellar motor switch protein FliG [Rhodobacteraceae bacterium]|jgi:flagellar motor switch protein FliG|nr:flagellar motor switch protein FliG [Paracoccaceae bacterium]